MRSKACSFEPPSPAYLDVIVSSDLLWLEAPAEADRRLRAVGCAIEVVVRRVVVSRRIVYESPILGSQEEVVSQVNIGSTAIDKGGACLRSWRR